MSGTRPRLRIVVTALGATAGTVALGFALVSCGRAVAGEGQENPELVGVVFSGSGSQDARVVLDAVGDHFHVGPCAGKDPVALPRSWSAALVAVPAPLLDGGAECGKRVAVSTSGGTTVVGTVVGACSGCSGTTSRSARRCSGAWRPLLS